MVRVLLLSLILFQSGLSFSQTYWKITSERGEQLLLTIEVNEKKNEFKAYTRKNALKDLAGTFNYLLALTAGKIQFPEVIFIDGKTSRKADSLILSGTFYYIEKKFPFRASIYGNHISGSFTDNRNRVNLISGIRVPDSRPINDYKYVINSANSITERYIFNPEWLKSDEWLKFSEKINELKPMIADDYEIGAAYFWLGKNLPFLPYELNRESPFKKTNGTIRKMTIREPKAGIALIDAGMLPRGTAEMDTLALLIEKKKCSALIIDLRGRSKILPESVEYMAGYLATKPFTGGIYPTRRFFDANRALPKMPDYPKFFKSFTEGGFVDGEIHKEQGRYYKINPVKKPFRGKVYVLTDSRTSGVSSSFIYILKNHKMASIVGQMASASSVLSERITINNDFSLTLVVSDFFTPENRHLNQTDLVPDIILHDEDALKYVLKNF